MAEPTEPGVVMVLAGGVALGAYQAGAYAAMDKRYRTRLSRIAATSIGAVNAAILAGNPPGRRIAMLDRFWEEAGRPSALAPAQFPAEDLWAEALSWLDIAQTRALGRSGLFAPHPMPALLGRGLLGLYRLQPLARALARHADFGRINGGDVRLSVLTTDLATGEPVVFDTGRGDIITPQTILASCGFVPEFEPTTIDGRLLGDGAFAANAPVELVLAEAPAEGDLVCFVLDLFAADAGSPGSLNAAAELRRDLLLAGPTRRALAALEREDTLRRALADALDRLPAKARGEAELERAARRGATTVVHLSYRSAAGEAGPQKHFDFSRTSLARRRRAGSDDMAVAMERLRAPAGDGWTLHRIRR